MTSSTNKTQATYQGLFIVYTAHCVEFCPGLWTQVHDETKKFTGLGTSTAIAAPLCGAAMEKGKVCEPKDRMRVKQNVLCMSVQSLLESSAMKFCNLIGMFLTSSSVEITKGQTLSLQ